MKLLKYDLLNAMKTSGNFSLRHAFIIHSLFDVRVSFSSDSEVNVAENGCRDISDKQVLLLVTVMAGDG